LQLFFLPFFSRMETVSGFFFDNAVEYGMKP
jgi:hypothetical protein